MRRTGAANARVRSAGRLRPSGHRVQNWPLLCNSKRSAPSLLQRLNQFQARELIKKLYARYRAVIILLKCHDLSQLRAGGDGGRGRDDVDFDFLPNKGSGGTYTAIVTKQNNNQTPSPFGGGKTD